MGDIRRQASLGTEFSRVYSEDSNQLRMILARVTKVNFRYNTVDIISVSGKLKSDKNGKEQGRFSAKLPVQFAGRTVEGKPYGQTTPITVGSLVLVGFIDGQKSQPVVISIYNESDEAKDISRSPIAGETFPNEMMTKDTQHQFTVYPSLTYKDIDGHGNITLSFTGKSFLATDSDIDPEIANLTDDGHGTNYEELDSSYYYTGELIQPKDNKAPSILFRHSGNIINKDGEEVEDSHVTMMNLSQDGTYRVSVLREDEDWRSFLELGSDGKIKLRRQNDSKALNQGEEYSEISLEEQGIILRYGDKYIVLGPDGLEGNVGLGAGDSEAIEELKKGLVDQSTRIDKTEEYVKITATKLVKDVEDKITEFDATLEVTAEQIETNVTEKISQDISSELSDIADDIERLNNESLESLGILNDLLDDGVLSPLDKKSVLMEWDAIKAEYPGYLTQADLAGVDTSTYTNIYNTLSSYIEPLLVTMDESSNVDRNVFNTNFQNYFNSRNNLLSGVFSYLKSTIDTLEESIIDAGKDATDALSKSIDALGKAGDATALLNGMASDDIITPQEKYTLKREYQEILGEWENNIAQAITYEVPYLNYEDAKDAVVDFVNNSAIFADMQTSTEVNDILFSEVFLTYYEEKSILLRNVVNETRSILTGFEGNLEQFETSITETSKEISLVAESVSLLGKDVNLNKATLSVQSDKISQGVTKVVMQREVNNTVNKLNNVGRNLFIKQVASVGGLNPDNGDVIGGSNNPEVSHYIAIDSLSSYVASAFGSLDLNNLVVSWYDYSKVFISSNSVSDSSDPLVLTVTSPEGAKYARVATQRANVVDIQFEKGTVQREFKYSPEDTVADLEVARVERDSRKEAYETYQNRANDYKATGIQDLATVEGVVSDSSMTPEEKIVIQDMLVSLEDDYNLILSEAEAYSVDTIGLQGYFTSLNQYMDQFFVDMNIAQEVIPSTIVDLYNDMFNARNNVYGKIVSKTLESYEASNTILDEVSQSALEAQKLAERLAEEAEQLARESSYIKELTISSENTESRVMTRIQSIASTGVLEAIDKPYVEGVLSDMSDESPEVVALANVHTLSTADYENALSSLSSYLSPMLVASQLREDTEINTQTFTNYFQSYYTSKLALLQAILDGANGRYEAINNRANIANEEYKRRQEQMNTYNNAIIDSKANIERLNEEVEELNNTVPYVVEITSTNGLIFRNNNVDTTLIARVIRGTEDITSSISVADFIWVKLDQDGNVDTSWGISHAGIGNELDLTYEDVQGKATFKIKIEMRN